MMLYRVQVKGEKVGAEGGERSDLFLLNDKSQVQHVEGGADTGYGDGIQRRVRNVKYFLKTWQLR